MLVDLIDFYNHIILPKGNIPESVSSNKSVFGVNGVVLVEQPILPNKNCLIQSNNGFFDNIVCDGQAINTDLCMVKKLTIVGFSELGTVKENIIITHEDEEYRYEFVMKTFHTNYNYSVENTLNKKCKRISVALGSDGQNHNIFSYDIDLKTPIKIKRLLLPVNLSVHILFIEYS